MFLNLINKKLQIIYNNLHKTKIINCKKINVAINNNQIVEHYKCKFIIPILQIFNIQIKSYSIYLDFICENDINVKYRKVINSYFNCGFFNSNFNDCLYYYKIKHYLVNLILNKK